MLLRTTNHPTTRSCTPVQLGRPRIGLGLSQVAESVWPDTLLSRGQYPVGIDRVLLQAQLVRKTGAQRRPRRLGLGAYLDLFDESVVGMVVEVIEVRNQIWEDERMSKASNEILTSHTHMVHVSTIHAVPAFLGFLVETVVQVVHSLPLDRVLLIVGEHVLFGSVQVSKPS
jgi:hypothetical protein